MSKKSVSYFSIVNEQGVLVSDINIKKDGGNLVITMCKKDSKNPLWMNDDKSKYSDYIKLIKYLNKSDKDHKYSICDYTTKEVYKISLFGGIIK